MAISDPPGGGPKIAILGALRCRVRGGWGGSAHYPDPTAQSVPAQSKDGAPHEPGRTVGSGRSRGPGRSGPAVAPPWLAGWLILRPLRGGWTKVAAAPFGVGDPRPGTGVPSRARSLV